MHFLDGELAGFWMFKYTTLLGEKPTFTTKLTLKCYTKFDESAVQ